VRTDAKQRENQEVKTRTRDYLTLTFAVVSLACVPVACAVLEMIYGN
jgi:hypothetical protein